jgi:hypothetical protein
MIRDTGSRFLMAVAGVLFDLNKVITQRPE